MPVNPGCRQSVQNPVQFLVVLDKALCVDYGNPLHLQQIAIAGIATVVKGG